MDIENILLVQKSVISVTILRKLQILKKSKKQHQAAVTVTMFLEKVWTLQALEVLFLIV